MVSNDVAALASGESCDALLLTAKGRVIAPLRIVRRGATDFLLLTEPDLGERVQAELRRFRLAARAEIDTEEHSSVVVFGSDRDGIPNSDYGERAIELLDEVPEGEHMSEDRLELLRIQARTPRHGREIDDRVLPAEAGLVERAVSFTKGCYPGQEPIARLHHRGHANRGLRVLEVDATELPPYDAEVKLDDKPVGRVTSTARNGEGKIVALAYVRVEVPADALLTVEGAEARSLH